MPDHQTPRPILLGAIEPIFRHLGHSMGVITRSDFALFNMKVEFCIEVLPLPFVGDKPVKTGSWFVILFTHVPLANEGGLVADFLQVRREIGRTGRDGRVVINDAVAMGEDTGPDGRTAGTTQRRSHEGIPEMSPFSRQSVEVGGVQPGLSFQEAERVVTVIIGEDEDDVAVPGALRVGGCRCSQSGTNGAENISAGHSSSVH